MPPPQCHLMSSSGRGRPGPTGPGAGPLAANDKPDGTDAEPAPSSHPDPGATALVASRDWRYQYKVTWSWLGPCGIIPPPGFRAERPKAPDDARHDLSARGGRRPGV